MKKGTIVTTGEGRECLMGTVVAANGKWVTIKYLDYVIPRHVPAWQVRRVL